MKNLGSSEITFRFRTLRLVDTQSTRHVTKFLAVTNARKQSEINIENKYTTSKPYKYVKGDLFAFNVEVSLHVYL